MIDAEVGPQPIPRANQKRSPGGSKRGPQGDPKGDPTGVQNGSPRGSKRGPERGPKGAQNWTPGIPVSYGNPIVNPEIWDPERAPKRGQKWASFWSKYGPDLAEFAPFRLTRDQSSGRPFARPWTASGDAFCRGSPGYHSCKTEAPATVAPPRRPAEGGPRTRRGPAAKRSPFQRRHARIHRNPRFLVEFFVVRGHGL